MAIRRRLVGASPYRQRDSRRKASLMQLRHRRLEGSHGSLSSFVYYMLARASAGFEGNSRVLRRNIFLRVEGRFEILNSRVGTNRKRFLRGLSTARPHDCCAPTRHHRSFVLFPPPQKTRGSPSLDADTAAIHRNDAYSCNARMICPCILINFCILQAAQTSPVG